MIENIARHVERGEEPLRAAVTGASQITFTVISISLSLVAVFIPLLFMGGVIGRMLQVFAVTLSAAILSSAVISLTVTPSVYALLMTRRRHRPPSRVARLGEAAMEHARDIYLSGLVRVMRHQRLTLGVMAATVVATIALYVVIPKGLFPPQDTGLMIVITEARPDIPFKRMAALQQRVARIILKDPAVGDLASFVGVGGGLSNANEGRMYVNLKPLSERGVSVQRVINRLRPKLAHVPGVATFMIAGQDLRIGGRAGKGLYQFALWDQSLGELRAWTPRLIARMKTTPGLEDVASDQDKVAPQVTVTIDRTNAARLGVSIGAIDQVLEDSFAQRQVSTIYTGDNQYHVVLEVSPRYQRDAKALDSLYVPAADGTPVPLAALARFEPATAPLSVTHQGQFPAATISFNLAPGVSLSEAVARIRADADSMHMPATIHANFAGNAKAFAQSVQSEPLLILAALLTIYIVLGVLYESTRHPLTILSTLPSAGLGALLALILTGTDLTVISIIGVILLMGIVKKNGIILVDFAIEAERTRGLSPEEAILDACRQRFRPITMTTMTALLGALPLALALGAGGALRRPLGIAVVGGLLVSQLLTLYTTPVIYLALDRLGIRRRRAAKAETIAP
jgi:multidrug efflux pump subunit AcrB